MSGGQIPSRDSLLTVSGAKLQPPLASGILRQRRRSSMPLLIKNGRIVTDPEGRRARAPENSPNPFDELKFSESFSIRHRFNEPLPQALPFFK